MRPPQKPTETWPAATVQEGAQHYSALCQGCHGFGTYSRGIVPDLRRSPVLLDKALWNRVVIGGALQSAGMVSFESYLDAAQAETIRAYISDEAQNLSDDAGKAAGH